MKHNSEICKQYVANAFEHMFCARLSECRIESNIQVRTKNQVCAECVCVCVCVFANANNIMANDASQLKHTYCLIFYSFAGASNIIMSICIMRFSAPAPYPATPPLCVQR